MSKVLSLSSENPRYFCYQGETTVLVTSGEHYGALLNQAFDFERYLRTLAADGLNLTRIFSGIYYEHSAAFNITRNTLAPEPTDFICPWLKGEDGRYDLESWNGAYFDRLHRLMTVALELGIVVEFVFFCPFYKAAMWELSPMHPANHIQSIGDVAEPNHCWTLDGSDGLVAVQERLIEKIVGELNPYPNLYYEVCNEAYWRQQSLEWHHHMAAKISAAQSGLPNRHLISWNVANKAATVKSPPKDYSVFNFHYANPPIAVAQNRELNLPIGDNETGFRGQGNRHYRKEAWEFLLAGGALFNHLDYSFAVGYEDGTFPYPENQPGGGNATLRRQLSALKGFMEQLELSRMKSDNSWVIKGKPGRIGARVQGMCEPGKQYALYCTDGGLTAPTLHLALLPGDYALTWCDPITGDFTDGGTVSVAEGVAKLRVPSFRNDFAMHLRLIDSR